MAIVVPVMSPAPAAAMASSSDMPNPSASAAATAMLRARTTTIEIADTPTSSSQARPAHPSQPVHGARRPIRRDSLDRREALLRGAPGSRQRRRYENANLLSNPWAEPPLPSDWEVRPTYPTRSVPYYLAPLWDAAEFQRGVEAKLNHRRGRGSMAEKKRMTEQEEKASNVPREVRAKLKRARAAKGLLKELEEVVRQFVVRWNEKERELREEGLEDVLISDTEGEEEDEIVFVGRNGIMHDSCGTRSDGGDEDGEIEKIKLVFEGLVEDKGASFGRWLVHEIGAYYGLRSWSETVDGEPPLRKAFVGHAGLRTTTGRFGEGMELPKPLYAMV